MLLWLRFFKYWNGNRVQFGLKADVRLESYTQLRRVHSNPGQNKTQVSCHFKTSTPSHCPFKRLLFWTVKAFRDLERGMHVIGRPLGTSSLAKTLGYLKHGQRDQSDSSICHLVA